MSIYDAKNIFTRICNLLHFWWRPARRLTLGSPLQILQTAGDPGSLRIVAHYQPWIQYVAEIQSLAGAKLP